MSLAPAVLVLALAFVWLAGCGVKAPPRPPVSDAPLVTTSSAAEVR